jgi:predicted permease
VRLESLTQDVRYAVRGIRRAPLFATSVAATIGLGLGVLCSALTILNAYFLTPVNLPDARELYGLSWDTEKISRHRFRLEDFEAAGTAPDSVFTLTAMQDATAMHDGVGLPTMLVSGNYFQVIGAHSIMGRTILPSDATAPGASPVVVLAHHAWQSRFGADPAIVGKRITLGGQPFEVVGVIQPGMALPGIQAISFYAPLTMARAFEVPDPWGESSAASLVVVGRLRDGSTREQARAWFDVWLRRRFPAGTESAPVAVRVESRATIFPLIGATWAMLVIILTAFGLVLLVACANVTNMMLARGFSRQREIAVRLSLGANRWRVIRQLMIESLVLAVPAAAVGLALTFVTARAFPALIVSTFPLNVPIAEVALVPLDPDERVLAALFVAAVLSAVAVSVAPALRVTRANLVRASKGLSALDADRSRLRTGLVALQIGACVLFIVGASGLVIESRRMANPAPGLSYERVAEVRISARLRGDLAARLASDPSVERVAASWRVPFGTLRQVGVVASQTRIERAAGFMVVSPDYFPLFDIQVVQGRAFTAVEADESAPVALVSAATARALWPGLDPVGQTLDVSPLPGEADRTPAYNSVRIIGVTEDVVSGTLLDGVDATLVYFATGLRSPEVMPLLVRGRSDAAALQASVTRAVDALDPQASFRILTMREMMGLFAWAFQAFSVTASLLGAIGLMLAFSGTYAVVAFLMTQRTPEFGIRMALGASVRQIVSSMMNETLRIALVGLGAGLTTAFLLVRALRAALETIPGFGWGSYVVGAAIVLAATAVAALLPSLRAARIDPSKALRAE